MSVAGMYTCSSYSLPTGLSLIFPQESLYLLYGDVRLLTEMAPETISSSYGSMLRNFRKYKYNKKDNSHSYSVGSCKWTLAILA